MTDVGPAYDIVHNAGRLEHPRRVLQEILDDLAGSAWPSLAERRQMRAGIPVRYRESAARCARSATLPEEDAQCELQMADSQDEVRNALRQIKCSRGVGSLISVTFLL